MKASLIPVDGGPSIEITKDITVIGRKDFCDVKLDDPSVSKVHLLIVRTDGVLLFRDMASTNGTKVNGERVIRGALLPNDKLQIAACKYQVQLLPDEPSTNDDVSGVVTPQGEDAPVVRVYRAQELARPHGDDKARVGIEQAADVVEPEEQANEPKRPDAGRINTPPGANDLRDGAPGAAPHFVD